MLLKIDHIAYSSLNIESDITYLKNIGYSLMFKEKKLKNLSIKRNLLNTFNQTHELALMTKENCYSIELLNHNNINNKEGFIASINIEEKIFNKISIDTDNIEKSIKFWEHLGFSPTQSVGDSQELKFSSPLLATNFYIYLNNSKNKRNFLDDKNFNCLALITNSAEKEKQKLDDKMYSTTNIRELIVNNQFLKIFFVQRENNEIVEIIEVERK